MYKLAQIQRKCWSHTFKGEIPSAGRIAVYVFVSPSGKEPDEKNPLTPEDKTAILELQYKNYIPSSDSPPNTNPPNTNPPIYIYIINMGLREVKIRNKNLTVGKRSAFGAAALLKEAGYNHITMVRGEDEGVGLASCLMRYNSIQAIAKVNRGGIEGLSATKMRKAAMGWYNTEHGREKEKYDDFFMDGMVFGALTKKDAEKYREKIIINTTCAMSGGRRITRRKRSKTKKRKKRKMKKRKMKKRKTKKRKTKKRKTKKRKTNI